MDIVIVSDNSYLPQAATMVCSLLENNKTPIKIFLLHNGIGGKQLKTLQIFVKKYYAELSPIEIKDKELSYLKITHHFSPLNYYRLLIPNILPSDIKKVLYLDTDLIVRKSLDSLWNIDLADEFLAAVQDEINIGHKLRLGISTNSKYFNSGVMLINVDKWRKESLGRKVIDFVKEHPDRIEFVDQDGLNAVLDGKWMELPQHWNVQSQFFLTPGSLVRYADIVSDASIIHFTGNRTKPWQYRKQPHPFLSEYDLYRMKTPWKTYKLKNSPKQNSLYSFIKVILLNLGRYGIFQKFNQHILNLAKEVDSVNQRHFELIKKPPSENMLDEIEILFLRHEVISGPFRGLYYPELKAIGSSITPKLLGTYEIELEETIENICKGNYSTMIDIGCAEGYYACGFAKRMPELKVYAYDTDSRARELCKTMANANGFAGRINVEDIFTMRTIEKIPVAEQGFIFCDCEGAEENIFYNDGKNWSNLTEHYDLLMEIHDVFRPGISAYIFDLFSESYNIHMIYSVNDALRPKIFNCQYLSEKDYDTKIRLMAEKRPGIMVWFYMTRKNL